MKQKNNRGSGKLYIVSKDILPEAIYKTAQAKELMVQGEALTVNEAVEKIGISRSAFYKYRDGINPYNPEKDDKYLSLSLILDHKPGVLSSVLNTVANHRGNLVSINQGMPLQGVAVASLNINTTKVKDVQLLITVLSRIDGVKRAEVVSQS